MKKSLAPLLGITLLLSAASIFAADDAGEAFTDEEPNTTDSTPVQIEGEDVVSQMFQKLDSNSDGIIDKTEAKNDATLSNSFEKIAKNGKLDKNSYQQWEQSRITKQAPKG